MKRTQENIGMGQDQEKNRRLEKIESMIQQLDDNIASEINAVR